MKAFLVVAFLLTSGTASADNCANIIELSRLKYAVSTNKSDIEQNASQFCNEYHKSSDQRNSQSFGASYKFLSASYSSGSASEEEVASILFSFI